MDKIGHPTKQYVDINGIELFTKIYGIGEDLSSVILDAGYGIIASLTEMIVYDRAGEGKAGYS
jgi:hypothetical protein